MGNLLFKFQRTKHMKFVVAALLVATASAADCYPGATSDGATPPVWTNDANAAGDAGLACEIPECADVNTDTATGNANGGACTAPAADPACTAAGSCTDADPPVCTENDAPCTGPIPEAPAARTDTAVETDGVWAETDGTACTAAADDSADNSLSSLACESAEDCEGEDMVCAETSLDSVDQEHEAWTAEAEEIATSFLPLKACITAADCEQAVTDAAESEEFYKLSVACGATKLVAGFAALALASAM